MPIATPDQYNAMLDAGGLGKYAYPAINITSSETLNAALRGFADAGSDGIIQISTRWRFIRLRNLRQFHAAWRPGHC